KVLCSVRQMAFFTLALTPLVPAYFLLKPVRETLSHPEYLGYSLMVTSALLFISSRKKAYQNQEKKWKNVLCIGLMQTIALVPGISRSGSTISTARMCGWTWEEAARFS